MNFLKGKKTAIVVVIGVLVNGAVAMGYIPKEIVETVINPILTMLGIGMIRLGISGK